MIRALQQFAARPGNPDHIRQLIRDLAGTGNPEHIDTIAAFAIALQLAELRINGLSVTNFSP